MDVNHNLQDKQLDHPISTIAFGMISCISIEYGDLRSLAKAPIVFHLPIASVAADYLQEPGSQWELRMEAPVLVVEQHNAPEESLYDDALQRFNGAAGVFTRSAFYQCLTKVR